MEVCTGRGGGRARADPFVGVDLGCLQGLLGQGSFQAQSERVRVGRGVLGRQRGGLCSVRKHGLVGATSALSILGRQALAGGG